MRERGKLGVTGLEGDSPPQLLVVIHTEEEFDWSAPFDRSATATSHIPAIQPLHENLVCKGAKPTYVVDFPVASQDESVQLIRQLLMDRGTTIGAHLHPWVSPPHEEEVSSYNSYPGNLPESLERAKLCLLSKQIEESFGIRPTVYLAGRYGYGPNTGRILSDLGYEIDMSAAPLFNFFSDGGPDYSSYDCRPFWSRDRKLLRIPHTSGHVGFLCRGGTSRYRIRDNSTVMSLVQSFLARTGCVERLHLSPEGYSLRDMCRLTKTLFRSGTRVFLLSFHSPSLEPGHTPYVRSQSDVNRFNCAIHDYLTFFRDEIGGVFCTPHEVRTAIMSSQPAMDQADDTKTSHHETLLL
jgi:hypothetical protein